MADNRAKDINKSRYCIDLFKLQKKNVSKSLISVPEAAADKWKTLDFSGYVKYFKHNFFKVIKSFIELIKFIKIFYDSWKVCINCLKRLNTTSSQEDDMEMSFGSNTSLSSKQDDEPFIVDESSTDEVEVEQHLNSCLKAVGESPLKRPSKITQTYASRKIFKIQTVLQRRNILCILIVLVFSIYQQLLLRHLSRILIHFFVQFDTYQGF